MRRNTINTDRFDKNKKIERVSRLPRLTHEEMMRRAYANKYSNLYYDPDTQTLSISGTHIPSPSNQFSVRDLITDIKVPFTSWLNDSDRFKEAEKFFLKNRSRIKAIQGHSLGAKIAENLSDKYKLENENIKVYLYATPRISMTQTKRNIKSYRHLYDPISMFDRTSLMSSSSDWNPHNYTGYEDLPQNRIDFGEFLSKDAIDM